MTFSIVNRVYWNAEHILLVFPVIIMTLFILQGIMHNTKPVFTAQFHPEAKGGPTDTEVLTDCNSDGLTSNTIL